jgi:hypothetical protein
MAPNSLTEDEKRELVRLTDRGNEAVNRSRHEFAGRRDLVRDRQTNLDLSPLLFLLVETPPGIPLGGSRANEIRVKTGFGLRMSEAGW